MPAATRIMDKASGAYHGKFTGAATAQAIYIGFKPAVIWAWNITDGDTQWLWTKDSITTVSVTTTAVANVAAAVTQVDDGTGIGFNLPVDAVINETAKVYYFLAFPE